MGKIVRATIRETAIGGDYPVPTSERDYLLYRDLIDAVMPLGGALQADGTWSPLVNPSEFSLQLPIWARGMGQRYVPRLDPGHYTDGANLRTVLDDLNLQQKAADGAIELALAGLDAPWDGVLYDVLGVPVDYINEQNDFIKLLSDRVHSAGLSFEVDYHGVRQEDESMFMSLDAIAAAADVFDYYMFGWWLAPCSTGPYWWARESIENALRHGIKPASIYLGIATFARYWPLGDYSTCFDLTYQQAMQMIRDAGSSVEWIATHPTGIIQEKVATVGEGRIWLQDGDTVRPRLALVDEYGLGGAMIFIAGMGDASVWDVVAAWKRPAPDPAFCCRPARLSAKRPKNGNDHCALLGYGGLLAVEA